MKLSELVALLGGDLTVLDPELGFYDVEADTYRLCSHDRIVLAGPVTAPVIVFGGWAEPAPEVK